jgi:hypothetical protein
LKSDEESQSELLINDNNGNLLGISFGYLTSNVKYSWNKQIENYNLLQWTTNFSRKYIAIIYKANRLIELRLTQDCLDKYFIISTDQAGIYMIILPLKASPRCYNVPKGRRPIYERRLDFHMIDATCLSDSSALCLRFVNPESLLLCAGFLINVIKLDCYQGPISCMQMSGQTPHFDSILSNFWSTYAYQMLLTLGYRIKHQITSHTIRKINRLSYLSQNEQYPEHRCYLKLMALYYRARNNRFFDINQEFDNIQPMPSTIVLDKWEYVPRVYLTPYGVFPLPIKPMRGNRILRARQLFGPAENFCRVIIRDVDLGIPQQDLMQINEQWIKDLITGNTHIIVGDRQFQFLLCSNSQLRDRSFWFHTSYQGRGAEHIRQWMDDFSSEKCIGTRIARMALSLTGTTATITVNKPIIVCTI